MNEDEFLEVRRLCFALKRAAEDQSKVELRRQGLQHRQRVVNVLEGLMEAKDAALVPLIYDLQLLLGELDAALEIDEEPPMDDEEDEHWDHRAERALVKNADVLVQLQPSRGKE